MVELVACLSAARGWMVTCPAGRRLSRGVTRNHLNCLADFLVISALPIFASLSCQGAENLTKNLSFWGLLSLFSILLTASHGGYGSALTVEKRGRNGLAASCFLATSLGMLTLAASLGHPNILFRPWVILDLCVTPILLIITRTFVLQRSTNFSHLSHNPGPVIVCYNAFPADLCKALVDKNLPDQIDGIFFLAPSQHCKKSQSWPELPDISSFQQKLCSGRIKDVVFVYHPALDVGDAGEHQLLWKEALTHSARIWLAFDVASQLPGMLRKTSGRYKVIPIVANELLNSNNILKRSFDVVAAALLVTVSLPLFVVFSVLIRSSSQGPIFFRQLRTGAQGQQFYVLKFRTMIHDPHRAFAQASPDDPHITKFGRWLRKTSLDELPQLFNVLRGEMSLVGPRPHAPETLVEGLSFEKALQLYQIRHRVKPGITGLAQIRGLRGPTPALKSLEQRVDSDLEYIQFWSIWLDINILLKTIPAVLKQTNAC